MTPEEPKEDNTGRADELLSFKAGEYDLAILNIKMPKMNGLEIQKIDHKGMLH